jgi:hypothetical protein
VSEKHLLARANHAPWQGALEGMWPVSMKAEDNGEYGGEARVVLNLELECRSRFKNFDPKSKPNPANDPWE